MSDPVELELLDCVNRVPGQRRLELQLAYNAQKKSRTTALILGLFFGVYGLDRFYVGDTVSGGIKLLSCGGFLIWTIIDWFLIMSAADTHNRQLLQRLVAAMAAPQGAAPTYLQQS